MNQTSKTAATRRILRAVAMATLWLAGAAGGLAADAPAAAGRGGGLVISELMANNKTIVTGSATKHWDWIEIWNRSPKSVNLAGWYLTDDEQKPKQWAFPNTNLAAGKYLVVFATGKNRAVGGQELHTNFKLKAGGEYLGLCKGKKSVSAYAPKYPPQRRDVSYGLGPKDARMYFSPPTPGAANRNGVSDLVAETELVPASGIYTKTIVVRATNKTPGAAIHYTTDCSIPTEKSPLYTAPLKLSHSTILRTRAYKSGCQPSGVSCHSYLFLDSVLKQPAAPPGLPTKWQEKSGYYSGAADYAMDPVIVTNPAYAPSMTKALLAIPSVSIVTALPNLFGRSKIKGMYVHEYQDSKNWERPATVEWLAANNTILFKTDCGLQITGKISRNMFATRKKSFQALFRRKYGDSKLRSVLFPDSSAVAAADEFDSIVFRAPFSDGWHGTGGDCARSQYIVDEFCRRSHLAMGSPAPRGTFVHLYLDGLYWGVYNVIEHIDSWFAASCFGGSKSNWDVMTRKGARDGDGKAWDALVDLCAHAAGDGVAYNAAYQKLQGNNPDRTRNPAYPNYLDVVNYIDYLMVEHWIGNGDWPHNNWAAVRSRDNATSGGFRFVVWDAEMYGADRTDHTMGVAAPYGSLIKNAEFRLLFADRIYRHLFNGGALTANRTLPRFRKLAAMLDPALLGESARWGDQGGKGARYTIDNWRAAIKNMCSSFLPGRAGAVVGLYKKRKLYPSIDPPVFHQRGGAFTNGFRLTMTSANPVYYTLDGTDPREYGAGNPVGTLYTDAVPLPYSVRVKARARSAKGKWSALNDAVFIKERPSPLRVTEVMYHPRKSGGPETKAGWTEDDFEFIEVQNVGKKTLGLAGMRFTDGVLFDFSDGAISRLQPGEYAVVVKNKTAFTKRYAALMPIAIAGEFKRVYEFPQTGLSDRGETVTLRDGKNRVMARFKYDDGRGWPAKADGKGHSLVPLPAAMADQANGALSKAKNWRASAAADGSPGRAEP